MSDISTEFKIIAIISQLLAIVSIVYSIYRLGMYIG